MPTYEWRDRVVGLVKLDTEEYVLHGTGQTPILNLVNECCLMRRVRDLEAEAVKLRSQVSRLENQLSNAAGREARFGVELPVVEMELKALGRKEEEKLNLQAFLESLPHDDLATLWEKLGSPGLPNYLCDEQARLEFERYGATLEDGAARCEKDREIEKFHRGDGSK